MANVGGTHLFGGPERTPGSTAASTRLFGSWIAHSRRVLLIHRGFDHDTATRMADRKSWTMDLLTRFTVLIERTTDSLTRFTVLIERSRVRRNFVRLVAGALTTVAALAAAPAQGRDHEVARDLDDAVNAPTTPSVHWAHDANGTRLLQVLVLSKAADHDMAELRAFVLSSGGSVLRRHGATRALTVVVPASVVKALAQRSDVISVAPNRSTASTASTLETISGTLTSNVRTNSTKTGYSGLDGTGIGIAVLDSGVMAAHDAFLNGSGTTRLLRNVSMLNTSLANWTTGVDGTMSLMPGSSTQASYENSILNNSSTQDPYGHGTFVAAVAAGRAKYYSSSTPDTTGIAPNANIYDVQVLSGTGGGTVSDAIEGIEWSIYHAKDYNIRVLNLSLAASSTQSWQTDPLCAAVRSATAAGITVVVAAGNFGLSNANQEVYGAISSPGDDPSVITVGAVNYHNSMSRAVDTVDLFSSRGPTRGSYVDTHGTTQYDNVLKPDLELPGPELLQQSGVAAEHTIGLPGDADAAVRHLDRRARGGRRRCADAAGEPGPHPAADQGDPAVHGAAAAQLQPARAGRGTAERRWRHRAVEGAAHQSGHEDRQRLDRPGRRDAGWGDVDADAVLDGQRRNVQLVAHRVRRRQPRRQQHRAVHQLPADLRPAHHLGRRPRALPPAAVLVRFRHPREHLRAELHRHRRFQPDAGHVR